ncbi:hypothetical protein IMSHALPRED_010611 [Imshaugia aleurites]|uniref:Uncharacterized protein n=1 Tax=Imshaugia aleurites TaxID=172621 RepID=A0A8H3EX45_9LECA|nr:hypothetical protein IMSHALPRED_010611 [Imshaugia aleurites]
MPDIDSITQSFSPSRVYGNGTHSPSRHSPSRHASSSSLAAAATINAGFQNEESRRSSISSNRGRPSPQVSRSERERRRSNAFLGSYDPTLPGPGELQVGDLRAQPYQGMNLHLRSASPQAIGSPTMGGQRDRAPSLGELHQELEAEQEAQVNRLLEMIRHQQEQLQAIQQQASYTPLSSSTALDDTTPPSERSANYPYPYAVPPNPPSASTSIFNTFRPSSPFRSSMDLSRQSSRRSRTPSRTASPSLRPVSAGVQGPGEDWGFSAGRSQSSFDDSAFYQAETQMLTRENQMLKQRIRELERQLSESNSAAANSPATPSNLTAPPLEADNTEALLGRHASTDEDKDD